MIKVNQKLIEKLPFLVLLILISFLGFSHFVKGKGEQAVFQEARQWQIASDSPGANLILLWDDAVSDAPTGWTCISCTSTDDFYQKFIRGNSAYGSASGTATHSHPNSGTLTSGTGLALGTSGAKTVYPALANHTATTTIKTASSTLSGTNIPAYRNLKVIRYNTGIPGELPAGVIAIFDATPPSGWTTSTINDGRYIQGASTTNVTGGTSTHSHSIVLNSPTSSTTAQTTTKAGTADIYVANGVHSHTITSGATSTTVNHEPPYMTVVLAKKDSAGSIPVGMIGMFDDAPSGWDNLSDTSGKPFYQRFFKPTGTYGTATDTATHTHTASITTNGPSAATEQCAAAGTAYTSPTHTHTFSVPLNSISHLPPYNNVVIAKKLPSAPALHQNYYRWRDDLAGINEDSGWLAATNTSATIKKATTTRLRVEIANTSTAATADNYIYQIEYAPKAAGGCASSTFTAVPVDTTTEHFEMATSSQYSNRASTTVSLLPATDSWTDGQGIEDPNSTTSALTLAISTYTEFEYAIWATTNATSGQAYCFRLTNNGATSTFTYDVYPEVTIYLPPQSTSASSTAYGFQRKTWYDGARYWKAFNSGTEIQFWYSVNETDWYRNDSAAISVATNDFSIEADSTNAFIVYTNGYDVEARHASSTTNYPGTGFSWGASTTVYDGSSANQYYYPTIAKDTNNKLRVNVTTKIAGLTCEGTINYGGETYSLVLIGDMCWLSKNLNIAPASADNSSCSAGTKYCYADTPANCTTYGGLYTWTDTMCGSTTCNGTGESQPACTTPVQGLCPNGWHLPSHYEWVALERQICSDLGGTDCATQFLYDEEATGYKGTNGEGSAMAGEYSLWTDGVLRNHANFASSGLAVLPGGYRYTDGSYYNLSDDASLWSSTESDTNAWNHYLYYVFTSVYRNYNLKAYGFSVRCVRD